MCERLRKSLKCSEKIAGSWWDYFINSGHHKNKSHTVGSEKAGRCTYELIFLYLFLAGGILGASPYALGGIPSGMPVVSAVPNATSLEGNSSHYVTNRYVVGNQAAIVHGYGGTSCGEYISSKGAYHSMVYSR